MYSTEFRGSSLTSKLKLRWNLSYANQLFGGEVPISYSGISSPKVGQLLVPLFLRPVIAMVQPGGRDRAEEVDPRQNEGDLVEDVLGHPQLPRMTANSIASSSLSAPQTSACSSAWCGSGL